MQCTPCEEQFYACESATLQGLDLNAAPVPSYVDLSGMAGWLDGYVYAPPGGAAGMANASRAAGGCRGGAVQVLYKLNSN